MGAFLSWIARNYEELQQRRQARMLEIRSQGNGRSVHARLPGTLAELQSGWELFLEFALEVVQSFRRKGRSRRAGTESVRGTGRTPSHLPEDE